MKAWLARINPREISLLSIVLLLVVGFVFYRQEIRPAYEAWSATRAEVQAKQINYQQLAAFLEVREQVQNEYATLDPGAFEQASNSLTLSRFLRRMELLARDPGMQIVNAKPQAVEANGGIRRFPIRLSVSGSLPQVCQFVTRLLNGPDVTGLKSFSIRGIQGGREVECSLTAWLVRLTPLSPPSRMNTAAPSATNGLGDKK